MTLFQYSPLLLFSKLLPSKRCCMYSMLRLIKIGNEPCGDVVSLHQAPGHWQRNSKQQRLRNECCAIPQSSSRRSFSTIKPEDSGTSAGVQPKKDRRKRKVIGMYDNNAQDNEKGKIIVQAAGSSVASINTYFTPKTSAGEAFDSFDDYLKKSSLSPWVPTPDAVARRMLQLAQASPADVHYDLGCGDGRVNAIALQSFGVKRTVGIDNDDELLRIARDRLQKMGYSCRNFSHLNPTDKGYELDNEQLAMASNSMFPKNADLIHADLLELIQQSGESQRQDQNSLSIANFSDCTVLTMFFVEDALKLLKPVLEKTFGGTGCRIVTNGYAIPGWEPNWVEVVLDLKIHLYVMSKERNF